MSSLTDTLGLSHTYYQSLGDLFSTPTRPSGLPNPQLIDCNREVLRFLGLPDQFDQHPEFLDWISGNHQATAEDTVAAVYAGHQFGVFVPQLGDGRALLLGDLTHDQQSFELHLKGSGKTPYSRFGDGRAISRSVIREHLGSAAMRGLNIPTTHSLAICQSSEPVFRDEMADVASMSIRVARSHVRFGSFEYFYSQRDADAIRQLADFVIDTQLPHCLNQANPYQCLFEHAVIQTANLIAQWQSVGFIHGVMNTDNMSVLGDTLDYGPFAFVEAYNHERVFNRSDTQNRYALDQQPMVGLWNCNVLARCFTGLVSDTELRSTLMQYEPCYFKTLHELQRQKLGLTVSTDDGSDSELFEQFLQQLEREQIDYTLAFRHLSEFNVTEKSPRLLSLFAESQGIKTWLVHYRRRLKDEPLSDTDRQDRMHAINPKYILRQHLVEHTIHQAQTQHDFSEIKNLRHVLSMPYSEHPEYEHYADPRPGEARSSLSCAS